MRTLCTIGAITWPALIRNYKYGVNLIKTPHEDHLANFQSLLRLNFHYNTLLLHSALGLSEARGSTIDYIEYHRLQICKYIPNQHQFQFLISFSLSVGCDQSSSKRTESSGAASFPGSTGFIRGDAAATMSGFIPVSTLALPYLLRGNSDRKCIPNFYTAPYAEVCCLQSRVQRAATVSVRKPKRKP